MGWGKTRGPERGQKDLGGGEETQREGTTDPMIK